MAKALKIILNPDPRLRQVSESIAPEKISDADLQALLKDMEVTMKVKDGAGLAAPQIGRNIRVIVVANEKETLFMINPRLTKRSWAKIIEEEGCLSVLDEKGEIVYAPVERCKRVNVVYLDETGKTKRLSAETMFARVIQHEIDHLDGILFIDKITKKPGQKKKTDDSHAQSL